MGFPANSALAVTATFTWGGFICAISFMEAWLKFRAPGVTLPIGLGIGKVVFHALLRVEWVLGLTALGLLHLFNSDYHTVHLFLIVPIVILFLQSVWIMPRLDKRADLRIKGLPVEPSVLHIIYIIMEVVKVASLFIFGFKLLLQNNG